MAITKLYEMNKNVKCACTICGSNIVLQKKKYKKKMSCPICNDKITKDFSKTAKYRRFDKLNQFHW